MRPLLRSPEFCATCHKVDAPPSLNNYKHIRGFSAYDEWRQSGASRETVQPFYQRDQRVDCRGCHIPKVESANDRNPQSRIPQWKRWNDYGIGLLEQAQYGPAANAFSRASLLNPNAPTLIVNIAIAEMRTERFGPEREQWRKAASLLDQALKLDPMNWRTRYFRALVLRGDGKLQEAADELNRIAAVYPRDREAQRSLGQTLLTLNRVAEARAAFEQLIAIDPTDFGAWQFLTSIYASENHKADAERAQSLYLQWRDAPRAYGIALRFFAAHPQWADERIGAHAHGRNSAHRPVIVGSQAAPDR